MKVYLNSDVLENSVAMGDYLREKLEELQQKYSFITQVRGRGLMIGVELSIEGGEIVKTALEQGLLINCTAGKVLRFVPPLIVTQTEIDQMIAILDTILAQSGTEKN